MNQVLTPSLRFEGFQDHWELKNLKDVFELKYGKDHKHLNQGIYPMLGSGGIMRYVDSYLYNQPSVLIGRKGTIDKPLFITTPFWTVDTLFYTIIKQGQEPYFVYSLAQTINWYKYNEATGVPSLNTSGIYSVPVYAPLIKEQQKIASFLTLVDSKISQLTEKHRLLKEYKKGVMQQIFSQQLRFKDEDGKAFPEWEEKQFGNFLTLNLRKVSKPNKKFLALGVRSHVKGVFHKPNFDPEKIAMEELYVVKNNDLVLSITFAWEGAIAIASNIDEGGLVSHRFPTFIFELDKATPDFFKHVIPNLKLRYILGNISPGGA